MDRKAIPVAVMLVAVAIVGVVYLAFPLKVVSGDKKMRIDDFELRTVENGEALEVVLSGAGFGSDPRVSISLDVANRKSIVGTLRTWGSLQDVAVAGEIAVLSNATKGVQIVDISDPGRQLIQGSVEVPYKAIAVEVMGSMAFIACAKGGVAVVDFSQPESPFVVGKILLPGVAWDLEVVGEYLYVAAGTSGLHVVDISRPSALRRLTSLSLEGHSVNLAEAGSGELMVASVQGGVHFVDISEPDLPTLSGTMDLDEPVLSVAAGDGLGFATDVLGHLYVLDMQSDLVDPPILGRIELLGKPTEVVYRSGRVYVAAISGTHVVDVTVPARPQLAGTVGMRNARGVALNGGQIYVANSKGGLLIIDESKIQPLQAIDHFNSKGSAWNLRIVDRTLYLADGFSGLKILDIAETGRLRPVGQLPLQGKARDVEVNGQYAYIANYGGGLDVLDVGRSEKPRLLGSVETMGVAMTVRLYRGLALVVTNKVTGKHGRGMVAGLQIFDLSDPVRPQWLSSFPLEQGSGIDVTVDENRQTAYLIAGSGGVLAIDIADPRNPVIVGRYSLPWPEYTFSPMINSVYRSGRLYVANGRNGLLALDVTDRTNPTLEGVLPTMESAIGVSLKGSRAYLSVGKKGIAVADISDPKDMRMVARIDLPIYARQFVVKDGMAILGNGHRALYVVPVPVEAELLSATSQKIVCRFPTPAMSGDYSLSVFGEDSYAELDGTLALPLP